MPIFVQLMLSKQQMKFLTAISLYINIWYIQYAALLRQSQCAIINLNTDVYINKKAHGNARG